MKATGRFAFVSLLTIAMVAFGLSGSAVAQFSVTITVDENGHGTFTNTNGFFSTLPFALVPDPGPGGLASTLTYDTLNPPGLVTGDVLLLEPECHFTCFLDVVRFNSTSFTGGTGSLVFYSSNIGGFDSLADTPFPPLGMTRILSNRDLLNSLLSIYLLRTHNRGHRVILLSESPAGSVP